MDKIMPVVNFIIANGPAILTAIVGVLSALIGLFLLVPGPQPEATLQKVVDFLAKFSRK